MTACQPLAAGGCESNHKHNEIMSSTLESTWTGSKLITSIQEIKFHKDLRTQSWQWHLAWKAGVFCKTRLKGTGEKACLHFLLKCPPFLQTLNWRVLVCFGSRAGIWGITQQWIHISVIFSTTQNNGEIKTKNFLGYLRKLCGWVIWYPQNELLPSPSIKRGQKHRTQSQN